MDRTAPQDIRNKWMSWKYWSSVWNWIHYITGFTSAALTVVIAANAKAQFLSSFQATVMAGTAAGLAFLVTTLGAQTKGKGFEVAGRELEVAITEYQHDESIPEKSLSAAVKRGIVILNSLK